jgi:hypothetical protein
MSNAHEGLSDAGLFAGIVGIRALAALSAGLVWLLVHNA